MSALAEFTMPVLAPSPRRIASRPKVRCLAPCDPLADADWDSFVRTREDATFFHTAAWARVLRDTYGHTPAYFTHRDRMVAGPLLPVMELNSPLTGRRGVSLPFTDWSPPLGGDAGTAEELYEQALEYGRARGWRYFETRGGVGSGRGQVAALGFLGHWVELMGNEEAIFARLESSVRRSIRKAQASELRIERNATMPAMREYYRLHCVTRRRHGLPPQPWRFFENIARHVLEAGQGTILSARLGDQVVAAAVFFHFGRHAIYKFGASDLAHQSLRPNNLILWEAIRAYAARGLTTLHLGRTSIGHEGLRRYKLGFGARESRLDYCRFDYRTGRFASGVDRASGWLNHVFRALPLPALRLMGTCIYPHLS